MEKMTMLILSLSAVVSLSAVAALIIGNSDTEEVYAETRVETTVAAEKYTLRDFNGKLALFVGDETVPSEIFDVRTQSFGEVDRELLMKGITTDTEEEIRSLVEDYTS